MPAASFSVVPASPDHIPHLAENMRPADRREVMAAYGHTPEQALRGSLKRSQIAWTLMIGDAPAAMGGAAAASIVSFTGRPWLLATPAMDSAPRTLLARWSRLYVGEMLRLFPRLENWVHAENRQSLRWLAWCGFAIDEPRACGVAGELFHRFYKEGANYV